MPPTPAPQHQPRDEHENRQADLREPHHQRRHPPDRGEQQPDQRLPGHAADQHRQRGIETEAELALVTERKQLVDVHGYRVVIQRNIAATALTASPILSCSSSSMIILAATTMTRIAASAISSAANPWT